MSLKFTPPKQVAKYALFVDKGDGRGHFKVYNDLGYAKSSYHHWGKRAAKILENVDGEWYVLFDIPKGTEYKNLPWVKETESRYYYSRGQKTPRAVPMTREEYAEWRIKVEYEKLGITMGNEVKENYNV